MGELVVSIISLIILIPIIFFLPLGLTNKGKGLLIIIAFVFANVGILAKSNFQIWQTALIILLLTALTVYILDRRFHNLLFSKSVDEKQADPLLQEVDLPPDTEQPNDVQMEQENNISFIKDDALEVREMLLEVNQEEEIREKSVLEPEVLHDEDLDVETSFLNERNETIVEENIPVEESEEKGYMADIELLLENDELEEPVMEQNSSEIDEQEESHSSVELEVLNFEDNMEDSTVEEEIGFDSVIEESDTKSAELETLRPEDILESELLEDGALNELELAQREVAASLIEEEDDALLEDEENELEEFPILEEEDRDDALIDMKEDESAKPQIEETLISDELEYLYEESVFEIVAEDTTMEEIVVTDEFDPETEVGDLVDELDTDLIPDIPDEDEVPSSTEKEEQTMILQQQIFHTMVSQINLAKKQMSPHSYEQYVKEYLHPEIPIQEYYTFVSLLIEHYIRQKESGKLEDLLTDLSGKFTNYPVLDMEIQYLLKQYCEKTR
ncbi:hypothetical protein ABE096_01740 [Robertmurraya massiliosenegalensis]|uniref:hypothetical protein n=1 Tax=Robertmurraya TaxID=2837507 RepID=UPI0039A7682A